MTRTSTAPAAPARKARPRRRGRYGLPRIRPRACGIPASSATPAPGGAARRARLRPHGAALAGDDKNEGQAVAAGALKERQQRAMRPGLRHAVQIEPAFDLFPAARQLRAFAAAQWRQRRRLIRLEDFCGPCRFAGCFGKPADFAAAGGSSTGAVGAFGARGFFRSGLTCFATLSHSARSSSLSARLRRGATIDSRMRRRRTFHRALR